MGLKLRVTIGIHGTLSWHVPAEGLNSACQAGSFALTDRKESQISTTKERRERVLHLDRAMSLSGLELKRQRNPRSFG
eukprot:2284258-Amphidinium_carterae.1